jgi:hypothetical protein
MRWQFVMVLLERRVTIDEVAIRHGSVREKSGY